MKSFESFGVGRKSAFFELQEWEAAIIKKNLDAKGIEVVLCEMEPLELGSKKLAVIKDVEILSVFVASVINKQVIDALPHLKLIVIRATGYDNVDLAYAKEKGIIVTYIPEYGSKTVAELAIGLIIALARRISVIIDQTSHGKFKQVMGFDLAGKTIGIVGMGKIGTNVAQRARAFDMNILVYDLTKNQKLIDTLGVTYVSFETLLAQSDVITFHVPLTKNTRHMLNMDTVRLIKKGAILVNTSRGAVIESAALHWALENGILAGIALDVFEGEHILVGRDFVLEKSDNALPPSPEFKKALETFRLLDFENVILSPHNAWNTRESVKRILNTNCQAIISFITTGDCKNRIA